MRPSISVRPATFLDKEAIVSFCRNTFDWGDYIEEVYDAWLVDPSGHLLVGLVDESPAAIMHLAILENRVAWLEGMRVHPDFRRFGLATALDIAGRDLARAQGCTLARLATSSRNTAAQKALEPLGYRFITLTDNWAAPPAGSSEPLVPPATREDLPRILDLWERSTMRISSTGLVPDPRWRWTELTESRLCKHISDRQVRILPGGFSLIPTSPDSDGSNEFSVLNIVGDADSIHVLALAARAEAQARGYSSVEAMVPHDDQLSSILSSSGYANVGAMLIFEISL